MSADAGPDAPVPSPDFPHGGGDLGALIRAFDWSTTGLGPIVGWPQSLKTVTNTLLLSPVPIVLLWGEDGVMIYNDAYSVFAGRRHPRLLGSKVREGWPEVADFNDHVMKVGLGGGTLAYKDQELTLNRHGGPEQVWMNLDYSPVPDESGRPAGVIAIVIETSERMRAERRQEEALDRVRQSEARFRALVNATSDVVYRMSADWLEMKALDGRGFLSDTETPSIRWMDEYLFPEDQAAIWGAISDAIEARGVFQLEHRVRQADGAAGWTSSRAIPLMGAGGEIVEWFGAASDITARREAEQHLRLVINELNHRVKNNLAMTQAVAAQTFRNAGSITDAQHSLSSRISALAQANDLLTGARGAAVSMTGVLDQATRPHYPSPERRRIEGPDFSLSPKTALSMSLAMHELSTNALKYGAWSGQDGVVEICWSIYPPERGGPERLKLVWTEHGGPRVAEPSRRGFGTRLIERGLAAEMGGVVQMRFEPEGLVCVIDAPLTVYAEEGAA
ncbi:MAG TPA: HWE histidine kinase domain-containing protein [Caulobacteraceae bacterium]